ITKKFVTLNGSRHYTWEKGEPPKTEDNRIDPCVRPGYNGSGYFIWHHGYLKNNYTREFDHHKCVLMLPSGLYYWNHASFLGEYCADFEPGYDGNVGHYTRHLGIAPKDNYTYHFNDRLGYTSLGHCAQIHLKRKDDCNGKKYGFYYSDRKPNTKDKCVLFGPRGSVGYYVWHHPLHIKDLIRHKVGLNSSNLVDLIMPDAGSPGRLVEDLTPPEDVLDHPPLPAVTIEPFIRDLVQREVINASTTKYVRDMS
uniref:Uncharacterized protein n=1 Tax=Glossina brevipalpis TaxID=37001 RepID=A0A1A9WI53_9MUSC